MKYFLRFAFCIGLLVSACGINVYGAISLRGDGFINFDGTGQFLVSRFPITFVRYSSNCTPSTIPGLIIICEEPLDMSLLGNDIVRAEHVRIGISLRDLRFGFSMRFGCPTCSTSILVDEDDFVSLSSFVWRLSDQANQALQAFIDQHGASSVYMSISLQGTSVDVFSSVQAVAMDIKPGDVPNTLNSRSHGVIPVAILTTEQFDATSVDVSSLRFGATGKEATAVRAVFDDVDDDGDTDLLVFFRSGDTGIGCETLFTYISGTTLTGENIAGTDSVNIVGCRP
jgi:hypothetical protein